jgi:hypothetical protein
MATSITKSAGCGLQLVGVVLVFIGIGLFGLVFEGDFDGGLLFGALVVLSLGVWAFRLGRRPALPPHRR